MGDMDVPLQEREVARLERECLNHDVSPTFLSSYYDEGSSDPVSRALVEAVEECVGLFSAMEPREIEGVFWGLEPGYGDWVGERPADPYDPGYLERLAVYYLATLLRRRGRSFKDVVKADPKASAVLEEYPELAERFDKDGLLVLGGDLELADGGVLYRDHVLRYHQFFRSGYVAGQNNDFLWRFRRYRRESGEENGFRIAIDHRRLTPKASYEAWVERSRWRGPGFGREKLDDPGVVGLTIVKREEPGLADLFGSGAPLERTEFFWKHDDGVKTLEIEEISERERLFDSYYLNRYVHSEREVDEGRLRHFDGAVKVYAKDRYDLDRFSRTMPHEERSQYKVKLFRIDGEVDPERWLDLIGYFFSGNEMVLEYFDPEEYDRVFGETIGKLRALRLGAPRRRSS